MKRTILIGTLAAPLLLLQGCLHNEDDATARIFSVEVTNLTHNQPLSPAAAVLHTNGYDGFSLGAMAHNDLELLAEGGDNSDFLATAESHNKVLDSAGGSGAIAPGASANLQVQGFASQPRLTLATMLVNTNDAFVGLDGVALGELARNDAITLHARVYDAGTEANSESAATIPGPAGGGEGYNAGRDDRDFIAIHPGVVSQDDGLATSALDASHRFDNPGARIVITRTQ